MKCQNCGKKEANFHCTSNIDGCVSEAHLCSECAAKLGYGFSHTLSAGNVFDDFMPIFGAPGRFFPMAMPAMAPAAPFRFAARPMPGGLAMQGVSDSDCCYSCDEPCEGEDGAGVDHEMKKRRELYMQMRAAADSEDFEKAALIRDQIKGLEA